MKKVKKNVTMSPEVVKLVELHVARGAATSFSAAINEAAALWIMEQNK